jgi:hypothetical protein
VKRIRDKLQDIKRPSDYANVVDDIKTMRNALKESVLVKKQFVLNTPHIFIIDGSDSINSDEFEDLLYAPCTIVPCLPLSFWKCPEKTEMDCIFNEIDQNGNYTYSYVSGVIGIFDHQSINNKGIKKAHWTFYRNPNAKVNLQIDKNIIDRLGIEYF